MGWGQLRLPFVSVAQGRSIFSFSFVCGFAECQRRAVFFIWCTKTAFSLAFTVNTFRHIDGRGQAACPHPWVHLLQLLLLPLGEPGLQFLQQFQLLSVLLQNLVYVSGRHLVRHHDIVVSVSHQQPDGVLEDVLDEVLTFFHVCLHFCFVVIL